PDDDDWIEHAQSIVRGYADQPDLHPLPELVLFLCDDAGRDGEGLKLYRQLLEVRGELADLTADEATLAARLGPVLVLLARRPAGGARVGASSESRQRVASARRTSRDAGSRPTTPGRSPGASRWSMRARTAGRGSRCARSPGHPVPARARACRPLWYPHSRA